jgi:hypothetical protein
MKTYEDIRRILVDELGFRDLDAYRKWIVDVRPTVRPTADDIARLSPDAIDCRAFWRVCDELFGTDPVCNVALPPEVGRFPHAIETPMDANRMNLRLAKSLAVTAFLEENPNARLKVLEIGPGYGSLKNYVETHTNHQYVGFDAVPRVPGVLETSANGLLPRDFVARARGSFSYVVASNVFQHLSAKQRAAYIDDAHTLLHDNGIFLMNLTVDTGKVPAYSRDEYGNAWAVHYGQYTPIPMGGAVYELLSSVFRVLYVTQRYDGLFHFVCQRRAS